MKVFVIGNPEAVQGFALVGISGRTTHDAQDTSQALDEALQMDDMGILMITEDVSRLIPEKVDNLKMHGTVPMVIEIPAPDGGEERQSLREVIQRTVGLRI